MAKEYKAKDGRKVIGWISKNGRRIPITEPKNKAQMQKQPDKDERAVVGFQMEGGSRKAVMSGEGNPKTHVTVRKIGDTYVVFEGKERVYKSKNYDSVVKAIQKEMKRREKLGTKFTFSSKSLPSLEEDIYSENY